MVEIIGPTGVGKSTINRNLMQIWDESSPWISFDTWMQQIDAYTFPFSETDITAGLRFLQLYPNYLPDFRKIDSQNKNVENWFIRRKRELQHFKVLCDVQLFQEIYPKDTSDNSYCIYDEGIIFKTFNRVDIEQHNDVIRNLLDTFPLPGVVIFVDAPSDIIAERAFEREKTAPVHRHKNQLEIHQDIIHQKKRFSNLAQILEEKGIIVYRIDATDTPENAAYKITELLNSHK